MYEHISYHPEWALTIEQELINDSSDWFTPKGNPGNRNIVGHFDYGKVRYVNRNLNYFYFENMLLHAVKNNYEYNPNYPKTLEFCNSMRTILGENGPFGRMCLWNLQAYSYLLPHYDKWKYHHQIHRYILCISNHTGNDALIKIQNKTIEVRSGLLFNFNPATEIHEFKNNTDKDWFFMGFDFWIPEKLKRSLVNTKITEASSIEYASEFGGFSVKSKYMSKE